MLGEADPAQGQTEAVARDDRGRDAGQGDQRRRRRADAVRHPPHGVVVERVLHHVLRDPRKRGQLARLRLTGIAARVGADVPLAQRPVVGDQLPIPVRSARDLPGPQVRGVGLSHRAPEKGVGDIAFGVDAEHRPREVRPQRSADAVQDHRVEDVRQRQDRIDIAAQQSAGLGVPGRDHVLRPGQRAERIEPGGAANRLHRLGEDVVGQRVVGDGAAGGHVERAVPRWAPRSEAGRGVDTDRLRGDADPRIPFAQQVLVRLEPVDLLVPLVADVVPLRENDAVESPGRDGTAHHDASPVGMAGAEDRAGRGPTGRIPRGGAGDEELLLDVARGRKIHVGREERVAVSRVAHRRGPRDGPGNGRGGNARPGGGRRARPFAVRARTGGTRRRGEAGGSGERYEQREGTDTAARAQGEQACGQVITSQGT